MYTSVTSSTTGNREEKHIQKIINKEKLKTCSDLSACLGIQQVKITSRLMPTPVLRIRIRMDPQDFGLLDPHSESAFQILILDLDADL
jgi:hypothetical protein